MNIDIDVLFPELKIELLKHGSMGDFFDENILIEHAGSKAMEDMIALTYGRCAKLLKRILDKLFPGVPVSSGRFNELCWSLLWSHEPRPSDRALWYLLFDAHLAAWEKALVPTDEEIRSAMEWSWKTMGSMPRRAYWDYVLTDIGDEIPGVKGWRPGRTWTYNQFSEAAFGKISFVHEEGSPAYLVFKFGNMEPLRALLNHVLTMSEADAAWVLDELQDEFKDWSEFFITGITSFLRENIFYNAAARISIEPQLDRMIENPEKSETIRKELQEALGI